MRRCKYIEDGLKMKYINKNQQGYGWDFVNPNKRQKKQQEKYGFDSRECFALDTSFDLWLYAHLKMYLHDAKDIVDLSYHKFKVRTVQFKKCQLVERTVPDFKAAMKRDKNGTPLSTEKQESLRSYVRIFEDKELTQEECIKLMIDYIEKAYKLEEKAELWVDADNPDGLYLSPEEDYLQAAVDIWAKVYPAMWW